MAQTGAIAASGQRRESGAELDCAGAQQQGGGGGSGVGDAAGGDYGDAHGVRHGGQQGEQADRARLGVGGVEAAAMAAGFGPLRHDNVGAGGFRGAGLGDGCDGCPPGDAGLFQAVHESGREQAHDGGGGGGTGDDQGVALLAEGNGLGVGVGCGDFGAPAGEEGAQSGFVFGVARGWGIRDPKVYLEGAGGLPANGVCPGLDFGRAEQQRAARAHAAGFRHFHRPAVADRRRPMGARVTGADRPKRSQNACVRASACCLMVR